MVAAPYQTIGHVASRLGVPRWRLAYLIERGEVPGPSHQVPGRRLFTEDDIARIRSALAKRPARFADKHRHQLG